MVDGRQLVLMPSGTTLTAFALPARSVAASKNQPLEPNVVERRVRR
jgi:hypothetical protein